MCEIRTEKMKKLVMYYNLIMDAIYSLWFCMRCLPLKDAIKLPVNISRKVKIESIYRGGIVFESPIRKNMLFIGHKGFTAIAEHQGLVYIEKGSTLRVKGNAILAQGTRLWIENNSTITLGDNFSCNKECLIRANANITTGTDVLLGWNIELNTSDGHSIYVDGVRKTNTKPINIGNHVWIASHAILSKGASINDDCVIAQRSIVTSVFNDKNVLIGGTPAKILKRNIDWEFD